MSPKDREPPEERGEEDQDEIPEVPIPFGFQPNVGPHGRRGAQARKAVEPWRPRSERTTQSAGAAAPGRVTPATSAAVRTAVTPTVGSRPIHRVLLVACLFGAFWMRFDLVDFGFPLMIHPDEPQITEPATKIAATGDLHPQSFLYPSFYIYLQAALYRFGFTVANLRGSYDSFSEIPETRLRYWGRSVTVLFSVLTIWLAYECAFALAGVHAGLVAALLTTVSFLHLSNSFTVTTDSPMAFWVMVTLLACYGVQSGEIARARYFLAGLAAGAAAGTKYNAVFAALPIVVAHLFRPGFTLVRLFDRRLLYAALAAILGFFLTTPYALLDPERFGDFIAIQRRAYTFGHPGNESLVNSYAFYTQALGAKFGEMSLALAALGFLVSLVRRPGLTLTTIAFPAAYFAFMGSFKVHFDRNMVVLVPMLAILAGAGVGFILNLGGRGLLPPVRVLRAALVTSLIAYPVYGQLDKDLRYMREMSLPDTRWASKVWIEENLPAGSKIAREAYTPPVDHERFQVTELGFYGLTRTTGLGKFDYVITSSGDFGRFVNAPERYPTEAAIYDQIFRRYKLIKHFTADGFTMTGPGIRIYEIR